MVAAVVLTRTIVVATVLVPVVGAVAGLVAASVVQRLDAVITTKEKRGRYIRPFFAFLRKTLKMLCNFV